MGTHYIYANKRFSTVEEVDAAILEMKTVLLSQPTKWCQVKLVNKDSSGSYVIPAVCLTDDEVLGISDTGEYAFSSGVDGSSFVGLSAADTIAEVNRTMREYASQMYVNTVIKVEDYQPTCTDMSTFVSV